MATRTMMREVLNERLARFLAAPGRFGVFGTGAGGGAVADALAREGIKPHLFIDSYRTGEFRGVPMIGPEEAVEIGLEAVVTASMYAREMTAQLRGDGFEGPVIDLTVAHQPRWSSHYDEPGIEEAAEAIAFARSLLQDDGSREVFDGALAHRRSLDPGDLPPPTPPYRHPAVPVADGECILDVGAFDGETALEYAETVGPHGHVHAFEPAAENLAALEAALAAHPLAARVTAHPLGAWKTSGELAIQTEGSVPSQFQVGRDGDQRIRVVALDDFVRDVCGGRVDWIKLDVEGAEHEALAGARGLLAERPPKLAVCIYHRPHDLWELPILLKEAVPGYRLHLGHHSQNLYDTVCYALPPGA
ncbi:MAG: FkbM family methyltransferase [Myxococcales bacterium]|nr:FkbM family methyltransferase [Myxococcales bacterium]